MFSATERHLTRTCSSASSIMSGIWSFQSIRHAALTGRSAKFWSSQEFVSTYLVIVAVSVALCLCARRIFTRICLQAFELADAGAPDGGYVSRYPMAVLYVYLGINASPLGLLCTMSACHSPAVADDIQDADQGVWKLEASKAISADEFVRRMTARIFAVWARRAACFVVAVLVCTPVAFLALENKEHVVAALSLLAPWGLSPLWRLLDVRGQYLSGSNVFFSIGWFWGLRKRLGNRRSHRKDEEAHIKLFRLLDADGDGLLSKEVRRRLLLLLPASALVSDAHARCCTHIPYPYPRLPSAPTVSLTPAESLPGVSRHHAAPAPAPSRPVFRLHRPRPQWRHQLRGILALLLPDAQRGAGDVTRCSRGRRRKSARF